MNKHTQTNWKIGTHYDSNAYIRSSGMTRVRCEVNGDSFKDNNGEKFTPLIAEVLFGRTDEEREANSRLIAAAPDLLDACQAAMDNLKPKYPDSHLVMQKLKQAIQKATNI